MLTRKDGRQRVAAKVAPSLLAAGVPALRVRAVSVCKTLGTSLVLDDVSLEGASR